MSPNGPSVSEVPSEVRNLDGALAKSDMHLLGVGDSERRVGDNGYILLYFIP